MNHLAVEVLINLLGCFGVLVTRMLSQRYAPDGPCPYDGRRIDRLECALTDFSEMLQRLEEQVSFLQDCICPERCLDSAGEELSISSQESSPELKRSCTVYSGISGLRESTSMDVSEDGEESVQN